MHGGWMGDGVHTIIPAGRGKGMHVIQYSDEYYQPETGNERNGQLMNHKNKKKRKSARPGQASTTRHQAAACSQLVPPFTSSPACTRTTGRPCLFLFFSPLPVPC